VVVLIDETPAREPGMVVVETLRTAILRPVVLDGQTYRVTSSMGLASYPGDGTDTETLLMNADAAMYRAKELGRNNFQTYAAELNSKARARLRLREQMREALDNDEFHLLYQPQIALKTNALVGVEALLRWNHPLDGAMSPADFIPVAEENGLIIEIGDWVLRTACRQAQQWLAADLGPGTMSVNVSPRQFADSDWVGRVEHALAESGLPPSMLELEITEGAIMQDLDGAIVTMMKLQTMGVRLAIDDFGTGYSSLSALKHFPIRRLKVDQSFVRGLPDSEDDCAIARAVILLGQQLHLTVIAEGVETEAQLDFLRRCDCDEIQGYRFSRPLQAHEVEQLARGPVVWPEIG
jgi:EAL domain-containing protein (putative c-di-GMP-specific phosphodiesterase class I)